MAESEEIQRAVTLVAIQAAMVAVMALRECKGAEWLVWGEG